MVSSLSGYGTVNRLKYEGNSVFQDAQMFPIFVLPSSIGVGMQVREVQIDVGMQVREDQSI